MKGGKHRNGNCNRTQSADVTAYAANRLNQYAAITNSASSASPREIIPSYDFNGDLTWDGTNAYFWDLQIKRAQSPRQGRRATAILRPSRRDGARSGNPRRSGNGYQLVLVSNASVQVSSAYDAMGRRVRKTVSRKDAETQSWAVESTRHFFYDGWNLIAERVGRTVPGEPSTVSTNRYVWGNDLSGSLQGSGGVGGLLAVLSSSPNSLQPNSLTASYPLYDHNGNVERYVSRSGVTVASYQYDAFGNTVAQNGEMADAFAFRFSTKFFDIETGLVMFQLRPYSPAMGRWMSRDKAGELSGIGLLSSLGNDLINDVDYLGLMPAHEWGDAIPGIGRVEPYNPNAPPTIGPAKFHTLPSGIPSIAPDTYHWRMYYEDLPDCPCRIPLDGNGCPDTGKQNGAWTKPSSDHVHGNASYQIRSTNNGFLGAGQQCMYDAKGALINEGSSAGTPDIFAQDTRAGWVLHAGVDWAPWRMTRALFGSQIAEEYDHSLHPPNRGRNRAGNPCPSNGDGTLAPRGKGNGGCCGKQ